MRGEQEGGAPESGVSGLDGVEMGDIKGGHIGIFVLMHYWDQEGPDEFGSGHWRSGPWKQT